MNGANWIPANGRLRGFGLRASGGTLLFGLGTVLIGLAAINADINLLLVLFGACLGAGGAAAFWGWMTLRRLEVRRQAPDVIFAGQPFEMRYTVRNPRRWGSVRGLRLAEALPAAAALAAPEGYVPVLGPGETAVVDVPMVCRRRGRINLTAVGAATRFPLGLFTKYVRHDAGHELVILPELGRMTQDVLTAARVVSQAGGEGAPARQMGDEEYYGLREYREGDNPKRIHWRRSAKTGQLMVREMTRSAVRQVWCVVATRTKAGDSAGAERLEQAISCAATVIVDALERGMRVGLLCSGEPLVVLPPGGGRAHRPRLLRELAIRGINTEDDLFPHLQRLAWPSAWRGPCLVFAGEETEDVRAAAALLGRMSGSVRVMAAGSFVGQFTGHGVERQRRGDGGRFGATESGRRGAALADQNSRVGGAA